jgi:endoglycosylceramidase
LNGKYFGTGFTHVPGGDDYRDRSVLSYHYYCIVLSITPPVPGNESIPEYDRVLCDDVEGPALFRSVQNDLAQLGGSAFLTEFGGCDGSPTCDEQLDWGLDAADQFLQSWAFWGRFLDNPSAVKRLSRIYARAIAGKPLAMQYIASQRNFYLSYYIDPTIKQPTEIYIPSLQFPQQSYNLTVNSVLKWKVDPTNNNIILVEPNEQLVKSKDQAVIGVVEIRPAME